MKKILSLLSALGITASSTAPVISCTQNRDDSSILGQIIYTNLGTLTNLKVSKDDNMFNSAVGSYDNEGNFKYITNPKQISGFNDYGKADNKIGAYEILNQVFMANGINPNYSDLLRLSWELGNVSKEDGTFYYLKISEGSQSKTCYFHTKENIQVSLSSVVNDRKEIVVADGSVDTILKALSNDDSYSKLGVNNIGLNNRLYASKGKGFGNNHTFSINNLGEGTVQVFDKSGKYGGVINQKIKISNYVPLKFDYQGNPYYYYNDMTRQEEKTLNEIDKNYKVTNLNSKKHVIVLGLDGIRLDKYKDFIDKYVSSEPNYKLNASYYSQPWESVYGWKTNLTGSIDGNSKNIFDIVNNANNSKDIKAMANLMWQGWSKEVLTTGDANSGIQNIEKSFKGKTDDWKPNTPKNDSAYWDMSDDDVETWWINEAKYELKNKDPYLLKSSLYKDHFSKINIPDSPGSIGWPTFKDIKNATPLEKDINALKSQISFDVMMHRMDANNPNLMFQYDTISDDEGHIFNTTDDGDNYKDYYASDSLKLTMQVYIDEIKTIFEKYGSDPNNLILIVTDHGRDSCDASHRGYDPDARNAWLASNKTTDYLEQLAGGKLDNYSIKPIIYNFLKSGGE